MVSPLQLNKLFAVKGKHICLNRVGVVCNELSSQKEIGHRCEWSADFRASSGSRVELLAMVKLY